MLFTCYLHAIYNGTFLQRKGTKNCLFFKNKPSQSPRQGVFESFSYYVSLQMQILLRVTEQLVQSREGEKKQNPEDWKRSLLSASKPCMSKNEEEYRGDGKEIPWPSLCLSLAYIGTIGIFTDLVANPAVTHDFQWVLTNRGHRRRVPAPPPPTHGKLDIVFDFVVQPISVLCSADVCYDDITTECRLGSADVKVRDREGCCADVTMPQNSFTVMTQGENTCPGYCRVQNNWELGTLTSDFSAFTTTGKWDFFLLKCHPTLNFKSETLASF